MSRATKRQSKPRDPRKPAPVANVTYAYKNGVWSIEAAPKPPRLVAGVLLGFINTTNKGIKRD